VRSLAGRCHLAGRDGPLRTHAGVDTTEVPAQTRFDTRECEVISKDPENLEEAVFGDCSHWFGMKFPDLDCPNWLPYLTADQLGQEEPKLTIDLPFVTDWQLPSRSNA
jgi:hypothetical protein